MLFEKVKIFFKSLEDKVSLALDLEKSISENIEKANELSNEFSPMIDMLEHHVNVLGIATQITKSEFKQVEYISLLDKHEKKLESAKEEYHTKLGELVKGKKLLQTKLDILMDNKVVNDAITKVREKSSLEEEFNVVLSAFDKGLIDEELFSKSFINFTYKYDEVRPTDIKPIKGYEVIFKSFYDDGNINLDFFEKAVKSAQEKKVAKVMKEFKAGILKNSSGKVVTSRDQAIAIAMSEAGLSKAEVEEEINEEKPKETEKSLSVEENKIGFNLGDIEQWL